LLKGFEALELLAQRARRRIGRVLQERQVQPLVPPILLRFTRFNPLRQHASLDHLHRQLRQSARARGGERRPIVGAQPVRQPKFAESRFGHT